MKVLMISNMYPSKEYPSYGVFVKNYEDMLKENNYEVSKIILYKEKNKFKKYAKYLGYYAKVVFSILFSKYDVVYVHYISHNSIPILFASKLKKFTLYLNAHGTDILPQKSSQEKLQRYVNNVIKIAYKVIVPSNYYKELINKKYNKKLDSILVFPSSGVDTKSFFELNETDIIEVKSQLDLNLDSKIIGYVGRIDMKKGWDVFLEAISTLNEKKLLKKNSVIVVGGGKDLVQFKRFVQDNNLEEYIVYKPLMTQKQLNMVYNCIDIFCFPTLSESLGLVGIEAMTCGTIIIGSDIDALREYIVDDYNGYLFEAGNHLKLSDKIEKTLKFDDTKIRQMKTNGKDSVRKYAKVNLIKNLKNIFR